MSNKVIVTARNGEVVIASNNNPLHGYVRVQQERLVVNSKGVAKIQTLSALIHGATDELKSLGWDDKQEIDGKIVVKEEIVPFDITRPDKDLKIKPGSKEVCTMNGFPVYRKTCYTTNIHEMDSLITDKFGNTVMMD